MLFNHTYELLHDRINIKETALAPLTQTDYEVGGTTALLDPIGFTIQKIPNVQKDTIDSERADQVLFVITTDGLENASHEFSARQIKKMVEQQKERGWEFIFLGANIDAIGTAAEFGIDSDYTVDYQADQQGTILNFQAVSEVVMNVRSGKKINRDWKKELKEIIKNEKRD